MTASADRHRKTFAVVLEDETVGTHRSSMCPVIGDTIAVELQDENGNPIQKIGRVAEILETSSPWG